MLPNSSQLIESDERDSTPDKVDEKTDVLEQWVASWAEYFRRDETKVEAELEDLCSRLRLLARSLES